MAIESTAPSTALITNDVVVLGLLAKVSLLALLGAHSLSAALSALLGAPVPSRLWPLSPVRSLPLVVDSAPF